MNFPYLCARFLEHRRMATSKEMTAGPALPLIFNFTLPLLFGNLLQQTYSLVDAAIVGKFLGINALASVGASTSVVFLILGFCNGCCGGFGIPVAQKFGARDYSTMRSYVSVSLQLAVVMSVISLLLPVSCVRIFFGSCVRRRIYLKELMLTCLSLSSVFPVRSSIICCPVLSVHWETVRRRFGFCFSTVLNIARFILHSGIRLGSDGSCHCYRIFAGSVRFTLLHLYVP